MFMEIKATLTDPKNLEHLLIKFIRNAETHILENDIAKDKIGKIPKDYPENIPKWKLFMDLGYDNLRLGSMVATCKDMLVLIAAMRCEEGDIKK